MNDERIVEYLRSRGRQTPPADLVASIMSAVDGASPRRSWFSLYARAMVAVTAIAAIAVLALVLGPGRSVGPAATSSPGPSATPASASLDRFTDEIGVALNQLRTAPGVRGLQTSSLRDVTGYAAWFDWRPNRDYVVVQRSDVDVTESGWWMDPTGSPPATGERVITSIYAFIGDRFLFGSPEAWQVKPRSEGTPVVNFGVGVLDGSIEPRDMLDGLVLGRPDVSAGSLDRVVNADGGVTWIATTPWRGGTAVQRWQIAADGRFAGWEWNAVGTTPDPGSDFAGNTTSASFQYEVLPNPAPIPMPDIDATPDPSVFGFPDEFPLAAASPMPTAAPALVVEAATCEHPSGVYRVTLPAGWWTNTTFEDPDLGSIDGCRFFAPSSFDPSTATPDRPVPQGVAFTINYVDGGCIGSFYAQISSRDVVVDGWDGKAAEWAQGTEATDPPGTYEYAINLKPGVDCELGGASIVAATGVEMDGDYEDNKGLLDEIMGSMEITYPAP